jgi:hypothetical protein
MLYNLRFLLFFLLFAVLPAYFFNKLLLQWIEPRRSFLRLVAYILSAALAALVYTVLGSLVLLRWVWPQG